MYPQVTKINLSLDQKTNKNRKICMKSFKNYSKLT